MDMAAVIPASVNARGPQAPRLGTGAWLGFYVLAPLLSALPLGWYGAGIAAEFPFGASMLLWISICMVSWWLSDGLSRSIAKLSSAKALPIVCLATGYFLNLLLSSIYNPAVLWWMIEAGIATRTPAVEAYFTVERNLLDGDYLRLLLVGGTPGLFVWLAGNYLFELITRIPRITATPSVRHRVFASETSSTPLTTDSPVATRPTSVTPRFFQRLTKLANLRTDELLAVEAEDHYIQVHSQRGKELIYYRFGDALEELAHLDGLRIHRSAWISKKAIDRVEGEGRNMHVRLISGERMRVSLSNRGAVQNVSRDP